jgi:hypothetical protein
MDLIDPSTLPTVTRDGEPVKNPYCSHRDKRGQSTHAYCPASRPQYEFHQSGAKEVFYGGAAGGGKTITMLVEGLRWVAFSSYRAIFFRRTYVELSQVVELSQEIFPAYGGQWVESKMMWRFPSGARYYLAYLEKDGDKLRYQGKAFHYIAFDELTQWPTEGGYKYLFTRNRPFRPDPTGFTIPCFMRAGSNPGGPGHGWVKKRFIDNSVPYDGRMIRSANGRFYERVYIPATLDDNQILLKSGGGDYETSIMSVADESLRKALRYGDWNIAAGAIFEELRANVHRVRRGGKGPFTAVTVAADWAYAGEAVALWIETDTGLGSAPKSRVYREWCTTQTHPSVWAAGVVARSTDPVSGEVVVRRVVLDSAAWATPQDGGPSPAEQMLSVFQKAGIALVKAQKGPHSIANGIVLLHSYFWFSPRAKEPLLVIDENCPKLWEQVSTIQRGDIEKNQDPEKPAPHQRDDRFDALRYWAQDRPQPAPIHERDYSSLDEDWARFQNDFQQLEAARIERARDARVPIVNVASVLKKKLKMQQRRKPWER